MNKTYSEIEDLEYVEHCLFQEQTFFPISHYIEFENCEFSKVVFAQNNFEGKTFKNVTFKQCNFSNINMNSSTFINVTFDGCNLIGIDFRTSTFMKTKIENSMASYSNFNGSIIKSCYFIENDFLEAGFSNCKLEHTNWDRCRLVKAQFHHTKLKNVDFSKNEIEGLLVGMDDLKGLIIGKEQAMIFLSLLGLTIKEVKYENNTN